MSEPHELVTAEHGQMAGVVAAVSSFLTALTMRLTRREGAPKESKEQREKRLEDARRIADLEEQLLAGRFEKLRAEFLALIAAQNTRVDGLQHENGSQGERLTIAEKDINSLWRRQRGEKPE